MTMVLESSATLSVPSAVAGISKAEALLARVRSDPAAGLITGVLGPGGCGKTPLLAALRTEFEIAGVPVVDVDGVLGGTGESGAVVLVDDAHVLSPDVLQDLRRLTEEPGIRMVVAFRPWPRPPALTALASVLRRHGPLTVLQPLGRDEVGRRAESVLGTTLRPAMVDILTEQTGGRPRVLDEVLYTLQETGLDQPESPPALPAEVVDRLRFMVEDLDATTRSLLLAVAAGAKLETAVLSALLDLDATLVREAVDRAGAGGLLLGDGRLIPALRSALLSSEPVERTRDIQVSLLDIHAGLGHDVLPVARALARSGIRNPPAAAVLIDAADTRLRTEPELALALYSDAIRAGAPAAGLAVRRAEAAVCVGRLDDALRLADPVLGSVDLPDLSRAIDVVATVMAHRGQLGRAAELYRWLGPERIGAAAPMAEVALLATGEPAQAKAIRESAALRRSPTMLAGAMALIAEGIEHSLSDSYTSALSALSRATSMVESLGCTALLLDSPAALTGLVAIHVGEFELAESVLRRAVDHQVGGATAQTRHLLLLAWIAMVRGNLAEATSLLNQALPRGSSAEPRDETFATAVRVGLARRAGDVAVLAQTWHQAREVILRQPVDLFVLLPLGEFMIAAAQVGESELLDAHVKQAWMLLGVLGDPGLWSSPLQWCAVQANIVTHTTESIAPLSEAMDQVTSHNGYGRVLAAATAAWMDVLTGEVEVDRLQQTAVALQGFGLGFEAAQLLSEAATRVPDRRSTTTLLQLARGLHHLPDHDQLAMPHPERQEPPAPAAARAASLPAQRRPENRAGGEVPTNHSSATATLSGRELQVARLLLRNQTYREIGERLFISPKTVEHHVARMKQRIGARRRSDLFSELRVLTEGSD